MAEDKKSYQVIYDYSDVPTLKKFALCNDRIRMAIGPFGSGKSSACVMEIIRRAHEMPPCRDGIRRSRWAIIRNSYRQLQDTTIKTFHDWFPPKLFGEYRITDHNYIITKFPGVYLEVIFRALDRPDQVSNLLSLELTGAWFNEAREIPKAIIEAMDGRICRYPSRRDLTEECWNGIIMDTNPPEEGSYLYNMFERVKPKGWSVFKQPSGLSAHAENTKHLSKNYYQNLARGKDDMYIQVYIHGRYGYTVQGKPVFQSFVDNVHVAPHVLEPMPGQDLILGFDFALQPACTIGQVTPMGQLRILDELVSDGMGLQKFSDNLLLPLLRRKYFGYNVVGFGDPSGTSRAPTDESTCFELLQGPIGLRNILPAPTNALVPRIGAVENYLNKMWKGEPGFLLSPNCHYLRKALNGGYHYAREPKSVGDEYKPTPTKNFSSHICLSGDTMVMMENGHKRIDEIKVGDKVVTPFGVRSASASTLTQRDAMVYKIEFSDGTHIICTKNHNFVTQHNNIAMCNELQYNDVLQNYNSWRTLKWNMKSLLSSRDRNSGFRQAITTERKIGEKVGRVTFIGRYGKIITGAKFLKDMSFTISTMIHSTMPLRTSVFSGGQIMPDITWKNESEKERWTVRQVSNSPGKQRKVGTPLQKVFSGIARMASDVGSIARNTFQFANGVKRKSSQVSQRERNSAIKIVKQDSDTIAASMTWVERVLFVVRTLRRINIHLLKPAPRIVRISRLPETRDVYNITVDKDHVFYANGYLTCNCDSLQYLCMYLAEKEIEDKQWKALNAQLARRMPYRPASSEAGY